MNKRALVWMGCIIVACIAFVALGHFWDLNKSEWASWVQAVGSIGAIGVAIAVAANQNSAKERQEDCANAVALKGLLLSIRAELSTNLEAVEANVGRNLEASRPGEAFRHTFLISENPFPVYLAMLPSFHLIADHPLRAQIVRTYGLAMSLVLTFQTNAELFDSFEEATHIAFRSKLDADIDLAQIKEQGLINYGDNLRRMYSMAKSEVLALLAVLPSE